MPITREIAERNKRLGTKFEWRQLKKHRSSSLYVCRSSGSHGLFDLTVLKKNYLLLIQCKRNGYIKPKERKKLVKFLNQCPAFVRIEVHVYTSPKVIRKFRIRKPEDLERFKKMRTQF